MTISNYDREITLASANNSPLSKARLSKDIADLHQQGLSAAEVADRLKIPHSHVGAIYLQQGWSKPTPAPTARQPHRFPPVSYSKPIDGIASYAADMIRNGYDEAEIAAHVKLQVPELRRRIAAAGL